MSKSPESGSPQRVASRIASDIEALPRKDTPRIRQVRKKYSGLLESAEPGFIHAVADELIREPDHRWVGYELIYAHPPAYRNLTPPRLEHLGRGMDSWWAADAFARTLSGPAWRDGLIGDGLIRKWAKANDLWWRRAALVSTVALNMRSQGGRGEVRRTLAICRLLVDDDEDMVVKAMSWALRQLVVHDSAAVARFLEENDEQLAARVKREVRHKLRTGLKSPRRN